MTDPVVAYANNPEIRAQLNFLVPSDEKPVYYASEAGADAELSMTGQFALQDVEIRNGRQAEQSFALDRNGFCLVPHESTVVDFTDSGEVSRVYEPEIQTLIRQQTGASRVVTFDHTLRSDSADTRAADNSREPSKVVHNDYTDASAVQRVRDILPDDEVENCLNHRFSIINVWRAIRRPVLSSPLAVCDAVSLRPENLVASERRAKDRIGELTLVTHNASQKWYYFPAMTRDEAVLIKTFDSARDGRARASIHTAFDDPASPEGAHPRESIESRCFVFFDE